MRRRNFLKSSIGLSASAFLLTQKSALIAKGVNMHEDDEAFSYQVGDKISSEAFISDGEKKHHTLVSLCSESLPTLNVLYIFGGGALGREGKTGDIWCQDSFEDLSVLRYLKSKYEIEPIQFIPVACPPIYSTKYYGYDEGLLLNNSDDFEKVIEATDKFIETTMKAFDSGFIPVKPYFDFRYRLMFNRNEEYTPGKGYGEVYSWQGKFRAENEFQTYGVPTIWLLDAEGKVLAGPFSGNVYHSDPYQISYTIKDIDEAVLKYF